MKYISINKFAALVGRTPSAIRRHCRNGKIRAIKPGRDWMILEKEIEKYKKTLKRGS